MRTEQSCGNNSGHRVRLLLWCWVQNNLLVSAHWATMKAANARRTIVLPSLLWACCLSKSMIETVEPTLWSQYCLGTYARKSLEAVDALRLH